MIARITGEPLDSLQALPRQSFGGFWVRFGALAIDVGIISLIGHAVATVATPQFAAEVMLNPAFSFFVLAMYFAGFHSSRLRATPGKLLFKLQLIRYDGARVTFLQALWRVVTHHISAVIGGIGFIMAAFTEHRQGLHDQLAATLVVRKGSVLDPSGLEEG
ncbi:MULTISPECIES: RDD family protein [unclassified Thioalkalivibrio]|uniref:RDD family protein n=1 Tax=unclassified Thioalkalivibrio TaxID=2621013 RepID=UPI00035D865C|nr:MULTISPECIES: RDD family protein [unclassified Thioalkalivibrio]